MRPSALCAVFLSAGIACAQDTPANEDLIKQLGSGSYKRREAAMQALMERPEAQPALRAAMKSDDAEIARRAATAFAHLERGRPLRELDKAIASGDVETAIDLIVAWPHDKVDEEFRRRLQTLADPLLAGYQIPFNNRAGFPNIVHDSLRSPRGHYTDSTLTIRGFNYNSDGEFGLVLASGVDMDCSGAKPLSPDGPLRAAIFSKGPVRICRDHISRTAIFSRGNVNVRGKPLSACLIVSGGDVTLEGSLECGFVIAKGQVDIRRAAGGNIQIISGRSVGRSSEKLGPTIVITENQSNPLGYIRWQQEKKSGVIKQ